MQYLLPILLLTLAAAFFFSRRGAKERCEPARVVSKRTQERRARGKEDDAYPVEYRVVFQIGGRRRELLVNRSCYDAVQPGDGGRLSFKGTVFIEFEPDRPAGFQ